MRIEFCGLGQLGEVDRQRALEVVDGVVVTELDRLVVRFSKGGLALELLVEDLDDHIHVDGKKRHQDADVDDVLHQDALARLDERLGAHPGQGHAEESDVVAVQRLVERPGRVVKNVSARDDFADVARVGLGVHRHHQVEIGRTCGVAVLVDADFVPGGQALDVRRKQVLARNGNPHAKDGLHDEAVGARGAGTVDVGKLEREIVGSFYFGGLEHGYFPA